jgi:phage shock protein PspC (stress-responsive transcriptional regulator)
MRAREGRLIAGICAGFAREKGTSVWLVRAILLLAVVVTAGLAGIAYLILAAMLPVEPPAGPRRT